MGIGRPHSRLRRTARRVYRSAWALVSAVLLAAVGLLSGPATQAVASPVNPYVYYVAADGGLWGYTQSQSGIWSTAARIGPSGIAPPGAHVSAVRLPGGQPSVFFVGLDGAVYEACPQYPQPIPITSRGVAPPGGPVATGAANGRFVVFTSATGSYNTGGAVNVPNPTATYAPQEISNPCSPSPVQLYTNGSSTYVPGGEMAVVGLPNGGYGVFTVDSYGAVRVQWRSPTGALTDQQLTATGTSTPGSAITVTPTVNVPSTPGALSLFFTGHDGRVRVAHPVPGGGQVGGPVPNTTGPANVPDGAQLAVSTRASGLMVGYAATNGAFTIAQLSSTGTWLRTDAVSDLGYVVPGSLAAATVGPASDDDGYWHCGSEVHSPVHIHIPLVIPDPPPQPNWDIAGPANVTPGAFFAAA